MAARACAPDTDTTMTTSLREHDTTPAELRSAVARDNAALRSAIALHLHGFVSTTPGVRAAVLANSAGERLASVPLSNDSPRSLAAMASSALAVGAAMLREAGLGEYQNMVIESDEGLIVVLSVGDAKGELLLNVVTDQNAMLGEVLWAAKRCCKLLRAAASSPQGAH